MKRRSKLLTVCASIFISTGVFAAEPDAFWTDQTGDAWGYVGADDGVAIVERSCADSDILLFSGAYYRHELKIPATIDSRPVVSINLEHRELVDCRQEWYSFMTIPSSITNITGVLDRNDPNCKNRARGAMFSVEGLRFLGDVPAFPELDAKQADTLPFSTASKIFVPRAHAASWETFLAQFGLSIAGYVNEETDCVGVTMRTKVGDRVWTYVVGKGNTAALCRWNEANDSTTEIVGCTHRIGMWTDANGNSREYGVWSEAACMPMTEATLSIPSMIDGRQVVSIDDGAFHNGSWDGCAAFVELTIPDTVTNVGEYAFFNYTNIQRLVVGSGVKAIGQAAFDRLEEYQEDGDWQERQVRGLAELRELVLGSPEVVAALCTDYYDSELMRDVRITYPNVTNVVLNGRFTALPESYFLGRFLALQTVTLPEGIDNIPVGAFAECGALTALTIPDTVTNIGAYAFFDCTNLTDLSFMGNAPIVRVDAFANVPSACRVRVSKGSTGWGVDIPGVWNGFKIAYIGEDFVVLPELGENPAAADVAAVVSDASDPSVAKQIDETNYNDFRTWAGCVTPKGRGEPVGLSGVMSAPNAWLSYALGSETLIENAPTNGQMKVEKFEPTATSGSFDFTVSIDDIPVGDDATPSNLAKVFGLEGGTSPDPSSLSSENVNITFGTPENGKVKFTAGPKDSGSGAFFMRVKMTP